MTVSVYSHFVECAHPRVRIDHQDMLGLNHFTTLGTVSEVTEETLIGQIEGVYSPERVTCVELECELGKTPVIVVESSPPFTFMCIFQEAEAAKSPLDVGRITMTRTMAFAGGAYSLCALICSVAGTRKHMVHFVVYLRVHDTHEMFFCDDLAKPPVRHANWFDLEGRTNLPLYHQPVRAFYKKTGDVLHPAPLEF